MNDTQLGRFGVDSLRGFYVRITSGTHAQKISRVIEFSPVSGQLELRPALGSAIATSVTYELHRYDPAGKFSALDECRFRVYPQLAQIVYDESRTADGSTEYSIPASIRKGPTFVFQEWPLQVDTDWSFVQDGSGRDSSSANWTASSMTVSTIQRTTNDMLVPKVEDAATRFVVSSGNTGTYTQVVANMLHDVTAAQAAGREMTFGRWVYCRTADVARVFIEDDDGTSYSTYHPGTGWSLLTVTKEIAPDNATTLSIGVEVDGSDSAVNGFMERCWFYFGTAARITEVYPSSLVYRVRRDDTKQAVILPFKPTRGRQLRFVGRDVLSALGEATPQTGTMEVDAAAAQLLYAHAAQVILEREAMTADTPNEVSTRIQYILDRQEEYHTKWPFELPAAQGLRGWWVQ